MSGRAATINTIPGKYALSVGAADMPAPAGWHWTLLEDVARLESGHTPSREHPEYWDGDIAWIGIKDARLHHGHSITETLQTVTQAGIDNSAARVLPADTVCLSRTASVGYVVVMGRKMATSQDFVNWVCGPAVEPHFLKQLFIAEKESLLNFGKGTTHTTIYYPEVKAFHVCLPPLNEQKRIVAKIEELTARSRRAKEALEAVPPLLDKLRQSILAAAFRGDLTADWRAKNPKHYVQDPSPDRDSTKKSLWGSGHTAEDIDPLWGDLPKSWRWVRVRSMNRDQQITVQIGPMSMKSSDFQETGTTVLNVGCVQRGFVDTSKANYLPSKKTSDFERYRLAADDILFTRSGTVGRCAVVPASLDGALMTFHLLRVRTTPEQCLPVFLMLAFQGCTAVEQQVTASSVGATRAGFNTRLLEDMWVPLAPFAEQAVLVERTQELLAEVDALEGRLALIFDARERLDQSILAKAFRGELVPQDPNDEPASVLLDRIRAARETSTPAPKSRRPRAAKPTPKPAPAPPEPAQLPLELDASSLPDEAFAALWLQGPLEKDAAVRKLAEHLRALGRVEFQRLRAAGPLHAQLLAAIEAAVKAGLLDRPHRGQVRAIKLDATDYTPDDWRDVLLASLGAEPLHQDDAIRQAAEWARDNLGLAFERLRSDGHIATGLRSAVTRAIRAGLVRRDGPKRIALASG